MIYVIKKYTKDIRELGKRGDESQTLIAHLFAYSFEVKSTILALP